MPFHAHMGLYKRIYFPNLYSVFESYKDRITAHIIFTRVTRVGHSNSAYAVSWGHALMCFENPDMLLYFPNT